MLWLDADEFPQGPKDIDITILTELSDDIRVVGADVVNHFPRKTILPQATTPGKFMPYGELFDCNSLKTKHCSLSHWKHPSIGLTRVKLRLER